MVNSKNKGTVGERAARDFLKSIGFPDARRTRQFNGQGLSDLVCEESLPNVHLEVKSGLRGISVSSQLLTNACDQAARDAGEGGRWVVIWRAFGSNTWCLTCDWWKLRTTFTRPHEIAVVLKGLEGDGGLVSP